MTSELLPKLGALADDFCFIHSLHTQTSAHPQGENFLHTGFTMEGFPSFGAWATYALGSENSELPAFIAINDPRGLARSGKNNFGNGFLPAAFQGTDFNSKNPPANLSRPDSYSSADDRATNELLARLNGNHMERYPEDANLAARIASYELAGRMQTSVPELMDVSNEPISIQKEYGTDTGTDLKRCRQRSWISQLPHSFMILNVVDYLKTPLSYGARSLVGCLSCKATALVVTTTQMRLPAFSLVLE